MTLRRNEVVQGESLWKGCVYACVCVYMAENECFHAEGNSAKVIAIIQIFR